MLDDLKYYDGSFRRIERIPDPLKELYRTAFEIDPKWLIEAQAAVKNDRHGPVIESLPAETERTEALGHVIISAWERVSKPTYYLRTAAATQIESQPTDVNRRGIQPRWMKHKSVSSNIKVERPGKPIAARILHS